MPIEKITEEQIKKNSMERLSNRPTAASRIGIGGLSPEQLKKAQDALALLAIAKVNELIELINADASPQSIAALIRTPIVDPDNDENYKTLYDVLMDLIDGNLAGYLALTGLKETTLWKELHYIETKAKSAYDIAVEHGFEGTEEEWLESLTEQTKINAEKVIEEANNAIELLEKEKQEAINEATEGKAEIEAARVNGVNDVVAAKTEGVSAVMAAKTEAVNYIASLAEGAYDIVQTTGDSETKVMSQKAVTDIFDGAFETEYGNNILPPDSESGYYEPSNAMTPMASAYHERTPKPIPVVGGKRLYGYSNGFGEATTWTLCVICLDSNGAYIKHFAENAVSVAGGFYRDLPNNCVAVHVWVGGGSSGIGISDICLSYLPLRSFEAYFEQKILSDDVLPEYLKEQNVLVWENVNDRVINGLVNYAGNILNFAGYKAAYATLEPNARYRITAYCPESVHLLIPFDESGNVLSSMQPISPSAENGGIFNGSFYDYNAVEFIMPPAAHSVALNSLSTYREPIIEKVVPVDSLREKVSDVSRKVDNALPLKGKVIVNFGDSIFGKRRPPDDISTELARLTGATVYNCGFGGCRMSQHNMTNFDAFSMYRLADAIVSGDWSLQDAGIVDTSYSESVPSYFSEALAILKGLDFNNVDIVTIAYGTNDFTANVDMENADNAYDTATFAGALRYSVEALLNTYPHLKIFICSQTYRFWMNSSNVFIDDSDSHTNSDGVKLTDFVAKTEDVAKAYHLPYIDNYDIGMNKYNRSQYFSSTDGTHPLTTGCHLIAAHIAHELF